MSTKREYLSGVDSIFFKIESEEHLMTIGCLFLFEESLEASEVKKEFALMAEHFPRLKKRVQFHPPFGLAEWVKSDSFAIDDHFLKVTLDNASELELRAYVADQFSRTFDLSKPLWQVVLISGLVGGSCAVLTRLHHAYTDGQGAVRMVLSRTTAAEKLSDSQHGKRSVPQVTNQNDTNLIKTISYTFCFILACFFFLGSMAKLCFHQKKTFKGVKMQKFKDISWTTNINLNDIKFIKNQLKCTVNDVLVAAVTGALRSVLKRNNTEVEDEIFCVVPVSIRTHQDWDLNNQTMTTWLKLPLTLEDPLDRIKEVHNRMNQLKNSPDAIINYHFINSCLFAHNPFFINSSFVRFYMNKAHLLLTNVPGPSEPLFFTGKKISHFLPLVPQSGEGGLGVGVLSYGNEIGLSLWTDKDLIPGGTDELVLEYLHQIKEYHNVTKKLEQASEHSSLYNNSKKNN